MTLDNRQTLKRYGEGKLSLGFTHRRVFLTENPSSWQMPRKSKKKQEDEKKQEEEPKEHASSTAKITAVLRKSDTADYATNFSQYVKAAGKSRADAVYNKISANISNLYGRNRPALVKYFSDYFKLESAVCNFNYESVLYKKNSATDKRETANCGMPYNWQAHHMIPGEVFTTMASAVKGKKPIFNARQYRLLLMSDYDINNGNNLIALPGRKTEFYQPIHDLIQHPSNHNKYTSHVTKKMKKLAKKLNKLTSDLDKPHTDVVVKIADSMKITEDELWDLLIKIGKQSIGAIVSGQSMELAKEEKALLKHQTSDGSTEYPLRALG